MNALATLQICCILIGGICDIVDLLMQRCVENWSKCVLRLGETLNRKKWERYEKNFFLNWIMTGEGTVFKTTAEQFVRNFRYKMRQGYVFTKHWISRDRKTSLAKRGLLVSLSFLLNKTLDKDPDMNKLQRGSYLDMPSCSDANGCDEISSTNISWLQNDHLPLNLCRRIPH